MAAISGGGSTPAPKTSTHSVIKWVFVALALVILFQVKGLKTPIFAVVSIVGLGLLLKNYGTIQQQFSQLGK